MNMQDITFVENEMEYTKDLNSPKTLAFGIKNNFNWWIISYGTHPCCYIEIPECHKFFGRHYDEISLEVHGGLTFQNRDSMMLFQKMLNLGILVGIIAIVTIIAYISNLET